MCMSKRVAATIAGVALVLLALNPRLLRAAAPLLIMAICPLSMVLMIRGMHGRSAAPPAADGADARQLPELEEEVNRLKAEIALRGQDRPA